MACSPAYQLVYCSQNIVYAQYKEPLQAYREIFDSSKLNNVKNDITGCLLFDHTFFLQILEGPQHEIYSMFKKIEKDQRHSRVSLLHFAQEDARLFPRWAMAGSLRTPQQDAIYAKYGATGLPDLTNVTVKAVRALASEIIVRQ